MSNYTKKLEGKELEDYLAERKGKSTFTIPKKVIPAPKRWKNDFTMEELNALSIAPICEYDMEKRYNELLDEIYPDCKIANYEYDTSMVLKEVDPIAYRVGFNDWTSEDMEEIFIDKELFYIERYELDELNEPTNES